MVFKIISKTVILKLLFSGPDAAHGFVQIYLQLLIKRISSVLPSSRRHQGAKFPNGDVYKLERHNLTSCLMFDRGAR